MKHVFWLIAGRLAGRPGPDCEAWSLPELRAGGIDAVLNLTETEPARAEFAAAQLDLAWVPFPSTYPADLETEMACLAALPRAEAILQGHLQANRAVLVHCAWGRDRTGLLLAYHVARVGGLSPATAIARVREVRPNAISPGWESMADRVISKLLP